MKGARHKKLYIIEFHLYVIYRIGKFIGTERGLVVSGSWWKERITNDCLISIGTGFYFVVMKIFWNCIDGVAVQH